MLLVRFGSSWSVPGPQPQRFHFLRSSPRSSWKEHLNIRCSKFLPFARIWSCLFGDSLDGNDCSEAEIMSIWTPRAGACSQINCIYDWKHYPSAFQTLEELVWTWPNWQGRIWGCLTISPKTHRFRTRICIYIYVNNIYIYIYVYNILYMFRCHSRKQIQAAHYIPSHCYSHPKPQPRSSLHHLAQEVLEGWLGFLGYALHITVVALKKVSPTDFRMQCLEYCLQHHLWNTYSNLPNLQLPCELSESFPKFRKLAYAGSANLPYISHRWLM